MSEDLITSPGKFEGEARYVPFYWERALDGCANEDNCSVYKFYITKEDEIIFPELKSGQVLELREDDNGFVHGTLIGPETDAEAFKRFKESYDAPQMLDDSMGPIVVGLDNNIMRDVARDEIISGIMERCISNSTMAEIRSALEEAYNAGRQSVIDEFGL